MTDSQKQWVELTAVQATASKHLWPQMAACEAALESDYGASKLAQLANNLFGMKQHAHPIFGTLALPTREWENSEWVAASAEWVKYPSFVECFLDRMATLYRLSGFYPHYAAAISAASAEAYVREVSATWSTDPNRAEKVLAIYNEAFPVQPAQQIQPVVTLDMEE